MSGDCICWSGDPDMPNVDIKQCHVDIQKCPYNSGDELSSSHVDIKPSDIKPSDIKSSDPVNINPPLSALKNVPVLTSFFAPILAPNVPLPPVAVGSVGEVKQEIKALPVVVNVPSVPGAPVPIVGVSEPGHSDMGRNNTGEETQSESEPAPESVPEAEPEENQSES